jgi:uncharacterized membrane protein (UPF0136 family)
MSETSIGPLIPYIIWAPLTISYDYEVIQPFTAFCVKAECALICIQNIALTVLVKLHHIWELIVVQLISVAGGVMGYMKSGSQKSLAAGGISALLLFFVHTQLPVRPVFASSIGLGMYFILPNTYLLWSFSSLLGNHMNLDSSPGCWCPNVLLVLDHRYIGCIADSHGISLQEVREDIPSGSRVPSFLCHGRRLLPWDLA